MPHNLTCPCCLPFYPALKRIVNELPMSAASVAFFFYLFFYNIYRVHKLPILSWKIQNRTTVYLSMFKHKPLDILNVFPSDRGLLGKIIKAKMC